MLIPSIDLMDGKVVQLVQGATKALEFDEFDPWIERFAGFPLIQLIDLDAAMGNGSNRSLIGELCARLSCQVGGGIRRVADAHAVLDCGARSVIVGSSLVKPSVRLNADGGCAEVDVDFAQQLGGQVGHERLVFALDARGGRVAIHGWKTVTDLEPVKMMQQLEPFCSAFLYTNIDTEGLMRGFPLDVIRPLRHSTSRRLIAAGGIRSHAEIEALHRMRVDAVVGMAIYSGKLDLTT